MISKSEIMQRIVNIELVVDNQEKILYKLNKKINKLEKALKATEERK